MGSDQFGVQLHELAKIEQDWRSVSERMEQLSQQLGKIKQTLTRATEVDLAASTFAGIPGFGIAFQVLDDVKKIEGQTHRVLADKERLTKELAQDAAKIKAVKAEYEETERKIQERLKKHQPTSPVPSPHPLPHPPANRPGHHGDGDSDDRPGHGGPSGPDHRGGNHGDAPVGNESSASKIPVSQVTYGGAGSWKSGRTATEDYINQALDKMGITDPTARANWRRGMLTIAERESSYNAPTSQVNKWDSNAVGAQMADGAPAESSRGAWQTIPSTFAAYHQAGTSTDIYDPVANAASSMNYIMSRYHVSRDGSNLAEKVQQADPNRSPRGY